MFCMSGVGRFQIGSLIVTGSYFQIAGVHSLSPILYMDGWKWIMPFIENHLKHYSQSGKVRLVLIHAFNLAY